jgi:hypothetical protein
MSLSNEIIRLLTINKFEITKTDEGTCAVLKSIKLSPRQVKELKKQTSISEDTLRLGSLDEYSYFSMTVYPDFISLGLLKHILSLTSRNFQVEVSGDGSTLWVNSPTNCVARITRVSCEIFTDSISPKHVFSEVDLKLVSLPMNVIELFASKVYVMFDVIIPVNKLSFYKPKHPFSITNGVVKNADWTTI